MALDIVFSGLVLFVDIASSGTGEARLVYDNSHTPQLVVSAQQLKGGTCPIGWKAEYRGPQLVCLRTLQTTEVITVVSTKTPLTVHSPFDNYILDVGAILDSSAPLKADAALLTGPKVTIDSGTINDSGERARCVYKTKAGGSAVRDNSGGVRWLVDAGQMPVIRISLGVSTEEVKLLNEDRIWFENEPAKPGADHFDMYAKLFGLNDHEFERSCYMTIRQDPILCPPARAKTK